MAKKRRGTPRIVVPRVRNLMDIKGRIGPNTLIHLSEGQWERALEGVEETKRVPKRGMCFDAYPVPGGFLGRPNCIAQPCEICRPITIIGPRGELIFDCRCQRDPNCPDLGNGGGLPPTGGCRLAFVRGGVRGPRLACVAAGCGGACRLVVVRRTTVTGPRFVITCTCT